MGFLKTLEYIKRCMFPGRNDFGDCSKYTVIGKPIYVTDAKSVHLEDYTVLRRDAKILNNYGEHVYIKKYTVISANCTIVTNNHTSTVGIPQSLLGSSHINDKVKDITIGEDVWVGANVTILAGANLGRGCIAGACCTISKPIPPYAVVVGTPARIVGVKFSIEQILEHEKLIYSEKERFTEEYLIDLFEKYYKGLKVFGVSTEFTEEHLALLDQARKSRGFDMPDYFDKISKLVRNESPKVD